MEVAEDGWGNLPSRRTRFARKWQIHNVLGASHWGQDNQLGGYFKGFLVADLINSHANKWSCDTFQPGAFIEDVLKNRNALPTELAEQVEFGVFGVCRITIALLLVATKHGGVSW